MNDKTSFIKGALILCAANAASKILGAVFKIPLTYILKEEGMAIFSTATSVYSIFITLVTAGIPLAVSRLVSADISGGRRGDAIKTVRASVLLLTLLGAAASILLFFGADFFATAMKDPAAALSIKIISPSVFFVAWGTAYKSYFQGIGEMTPTAISQVSESAIRFLAGYFFALFFLNKSHHITSGAAISGITLGEIFATLLLFFSYLFKCRKTDKRSSLSYRKIYSSIAAVSVPLLICSLTLSLFNMLDTATVRNQLLSIRFSPDTARGFLLKYSAYTSIFDNISDTLKLSQEGARWLYGAYSGYALTVFHLPLGMISTLFVSIFPIIAGKLSQGKIDAVRRTLHSTFSLTVFCAVPFCVLFSAASKQILFLLFHNTASADMLSLVSPCLIFLSASQLFTSVFHADGKIFEPFLIQLVGIFIKLVFNVILIQIPSLNIHGAIISSLLSFFVTALLLMLLLMRRYSIRFSPKAVLYPIISAAPMQLVLRLSLHPMSIIFKNPYLALFFAAFPAAITYLLAMSALTPGGLHGLFKFSQKNCGKIN